MAPEPFLCGVEEKEAEDWSRVAIIVGNGGEPGGRSKIPAAAGVKMKANQPARSVSMGPWFAAGLP